MSTLQPSWLSSLNMVSSTKPNFLSSTNFIIAPMKLARSGNLDNEQTPEPASKDSPEIPERVRIAFAKAREYKKTLALKSSVKIEPRVKEDLSGVENGNGRLGSGGSDEGFKPEEVPLAVKIAMEKAREYKKNKGLASASKTDVGIGTTQGKLKERSAGSVSISDPFPGYDFPEVEFIAGDASKFDDARPKGPSAGAIPISDHFPGINFPEAEFISGDASKLDTATPVEVESTQKDNPDVYEPKVSTWGIFPRPSNISKAYGGGRTIRPGEALETEEERAAKEARTKELIAAYKKKLGLKIDTELQIECEEALKNGDLLMDVGKLKEALPYYEKVMNKMDFPSVLYGSAALNWAICLDSMGRSDEAEVMYKKLQIHPNGDVKTRARHFAFSFQAMEMMKVSRSPAPLKSIGYEKYFDAFIEKKSYVAFKDEDAEFNPMNQALPYIVFLVSPIFMVLIIAVQKRI